MKIYRKHINEYEEIHIGDTENPYYVLIGESHTPLPVAIQQGNSEEKLISLKYCENHPGGQKAAMREVFKVPHWA